MQNLSGPYSSWYDKEHLLKGKTAGWTKEDHERAGFRMVPNSPVRKGSYVGKNAVLMPCYVNIGAYIDEGTMIDTFARAGSCCQIGKNCHISAGSGVGGVLEPAKKLGMKTVWLKNNEYWGKKDSDKKFVDLKIENLSSFLKEINIIKQS